MNHGIYLDRDDGCFIAQFERMGDSEYRPVRTTGRINASNFYKIFNPSALSLLPLNCRFADTIGGNMRFVIENPPQYRTLNFEWIFDHELTRLKESGEDIKYGYTSDWIAKIKEEKVSLRLYFPYVIFIITISKGDYGIGANLMIFYNIKPLRSFNDPLIYANLPNIFDTDMVCAGNSSTTWKSNDIQSSLESIVSSFWTSSFNHEANSRFNMYSTSPMTILRWAAMSKTNPSGIFDPSLWKFSSRTLNDILLCDNIYPNTAFDTIYESGKTVFSGLLTSQTKAHNYILPNGSHCLKILNVGDRIKFKGKIFYIEQFPINSDHVMVKDSLEGKKTKEVGLHDISLEEAELTSAELNTFNGKKIEVKAGDIIKDDLQYMQILAIYKDFFGNIEISTDMKTIDITNSKEKDQTLYKLIDLSKGITVGSRVIELNPTFRLVNRMTHTNGCIGIYTISSCHPEKFSCRSGKIIISMSDGNVFDTQHIASGTIDIVDTSSIDELPFMKTLLIGETVAIGPMNVDFNNYKVFLKEWKNLTTKEVKTFKDGYQGINYLFPEESTSLHIPSLFGKDINFKVGDTVAYGSSESYTLKIITGFLKSTDNRTLSIGLADTIEGTPEFEPYLCDNGFVAQKNKCNLYGVYVKGMELIRKIDLSMFGRHIKVAVSKIPGLPKGTQCKIIGEFTDCFGEILLLHNGYTIRKSDIGTLFKLLETTSREYYEITPTQLGGEIRISVGDKFQQRWASTNYVLLPSRNERGRYFSIPGLDGYCGNEHRLSQAKISGFVSPRIQNLPDLIKKRNILYPPVRNNYPTPESFGYYSIYERS